jgi:hypothetical protein
MRLGERVMMHVPAAHTGAILSWRQQAQSKLAVTQKLIAQGRGDQLVDGGGCTEPGGGIVPVQRTARETAAMMKRILAQESTGGMPQTVAPDYRRRPHRGPRRRSGRQGHRGRGRLHDPARG